MRLIALIALLVVAIAGAATAEQVDITTTPPPPVREPGLVTPETGEATARPSDANAYPDGPRVGHDPAFVAPLSARTPSGRVGVSGWTSPSTPVGPRTQGDREVNGWFALGLSITWDGPPLPRTSRAR